MKKLFPKNALLVLVQVIGLSCCTLLAFSRMVPFAALLHLSPRFDLTLTALYVLLVCIPAAVAWQQRSRGWRIPVAIALLPAVAVLALALAAIAIHAYHEHNLETARRQRFDAPQKIEQIVGLRFPDYALSDFTEVYDREDLLRRHSCRVHGQFAAVPPAEFYAQLDSLCHTDSLHWRASGGIYAYDSIYGRGPISKLVLSIVHTRGQKDFEMRYDVTRGFRIKQ